MPPEEKVSMELSGAEALVPFEFPARFDESGGLGFEDEGVKWALNHLFCSLEKVLAEPFEADHGERLREAGARVRGGRSW